MVTDTNRPLDTDVVDNDDPVYDFVTLLMQAVRDEVEQERKTAPLPMTLRQLYQTVKSGQRVTFSVFDDDPVTGYLAGIDDESYFVLEPTPDRTTFHKKVIRRASSPVFRIHPDASYESEDRNLTDEMDKIINPFRSWVLAQVYNRKPRAEKDVA